MNGLGRLRTADGRFLRERLKKGDFRLKSVLVKGADL